MSNAVVEIEAGQRFRFGENWKRFLRTITDESILVAKRSITEFMGLEDLTGRKVLDIGSGSGLFSLAARGLGAEVVSFDYDPQSVACTRKLRERYFPEDTRWRITEGSVLDEGFLQSLGRFDVVYSWGVLHHTGGMWKAIANAAALVRDGGYFFIGIYDDRGRTSRNWRRVKKTYCSGTAGRMMVSGVFIPYFFVRTLLSVVRRRRNRFAEYKRNRGMSMVHDWVDWLGGYPFEVARADEVFEFCRTKGFRLVNLKTPGGSSGVNEFLFVREGSGASGS